MKSVWFSTTLGVLLVALLVVSVSAQGYPPEIVIIVPPTIIIVDHQITFTLAIVYPDGKPAVLDPPLMTIRACGDKGCITVTVPVNPDGTVSIPITADFPTGTVTLYIVANSMRDSYGTTFPAVDTLIGTVTVPAGSPPSATASQSQNQKPEVSGKPSLYRVARSATTEASAQQSPPSYTIPGILGFLVIAGTVMVLAPRRPT